jgi:hypothetical protein
MSRMRDIGAALGASLVLSALADRSGAANAVLRVEADAELRLAVDGLVADELDRLRYFRLYHFPGMFEQSLVDEMKSLRVVPGRGTGPRFAKGDPNAPEWATANARLRERDIAMFRRAAEQHPGVPFAIAGHSYPRSVVASGGDEGPDKVDPTMKVDPSVVAPQDYGRAAAAVSEWLSELKKAGASTPSYFTPINEPDAAWKDGSRSGQSHADFSRVLAERLKRDHPEVHFAGPCTAWSHPGPKWDRWRSPNSVERQFIDRVGDLVDDYDFHLYSKELWAHVPPDPAKVPYGRLQPDARLFESLGRGHNEVWDFGKAEMMLDAVRVLHRERWGEPAPSVIISEFGRQGITPQLGPWGNPEYFSYLYGTTLTRMWMTFMDRPEIELTVPFLLPVSDIGYGDRRGHAMYNRPGAPDDPTPRVTPMRDFVAFFRALDGRRVPAAWGGIAPEHQHGMFVIASRTDEALFVLMHNAPSSSIEFTLDLGAPLPPGATIQRMRWEGPAPDRFTDPTPTGGAWRRDVEPRESVADARITLAGEETAILRIPLSTPARRAVTIERRYAAQSLVPLDGPTTFDVELTPADLEGVREVTATIGYASPQGGVAGQTLAVAVNGETLPGTLDLSLTDGWRAASMPYRIVVPARLLRAGKNPFAITAGPGGAPADALITTVRLDLRRESVGVAK